MRNDSLKGLTEDQEYILSMAARKAYMKKRGCNTDMEKRPSIESSDAGLFLVWRNQLGYEIARFKVVKGLKVRMQ